MRSNDLDLAEAAGAIGIFLFLTIVISVTIWQLAATWRAKATLAREKEYRTLAETAVRAQENTERKLTEVSERIAELHTRMESLERILKDVE